jgi:hypothetical protein
MERVALGLAAAAVFCSALGIPAEVAEAEEKGRPGFLSVQMVRTDRPPKIDGVLDESSWREAAFIANLTQVEPDEGAAPTERTEIRLLYDADFLYLGVRAFDSEPDKIIATEMVRDAEFNSDDHIVMVFDTFHDRRNAFLFRVNPRGTRGDGLIENSRRVGDEWDGIWYAKATIDSQGWMAEIAIPYKTISFNPRGTSWGFNIERVVRRKNEVSRWAAADLDSSLFDIADAGILAGLVGIEQGIGLDVKPSFTVNRLQGRPDAGDTTQGEPSLDVFYKITPALTAALTINTDFSETEVDEREINLTRFELFFPEKRDFFLQDAGIFEFGGLQRNGRPFFSRRIGLDEEDEEVGIVAGAKLTGRIGGINLGILGVQTDEKKLEGENGKGKEEEKRLLESKNLFVGRVAVNVLEQSTLGAIVTNGDPRSTEGEDNTLVGGDFNYRDTEFFGDQTLAGNFWLQRSFTDKEEKKKDEDEEEKKKDKEDREFAYGAKLAFESDEIEAGASFAEIQKDFTPALGFVNRRGIREYGTDFRYRYRFPRGGLVRTADTGFSVQLVTDDEENEVETGEVELKVMKLKNSPGDQVEFTYIFQHEILDEDELFLKRDDLCVPAGTHNFNRFSAGFATAESRPLSGALEVAWGGFFSGKRTDIKPSLAWRPSPFLFVSLEYELSDFRELKVAAPPQKKECPNDIRLPEGDFTSHLVRGRLVLQFTPDISWSTFAQYDNVSATLGINTRFRWIIEPGNELFVVVNQSFEKKDGDEVEGKLEPSGTEIAMKLVWTLRF